MSLFDDYRHAHLLHQRHPFDPNVLMQLRVARVALVEDLQGDGYVPERVVREQYSEDVRIILSTG